MKRWRSLATVLAVLSVGCAGLPPKQKPVQLSRAVPLDSLETADAGHALQDDDGAFGSRGPARGRRAAHRIVEPVEAGRNRAREVQSRLVVGSARDC